MNAQIKIGLESNGLKDAIAAGMGFVYSTAATGVAAAAAGVNSAPMIWNPTGSGVNLRIMRITFGVISGTVIEAHIAYGVLLNAGGQIGTGAPVVSFTGANPINLLPGAGQASRMRFAPATLTLAAAPTYMMANGLSSGGTIGNNLWVQAVDNVDGAIVIPPGVAFFPFISNGSLALTASVAVLGIEDPVTVGG